MSQQRSRRNQSHHRQRPAGPRAAGSDQESERKQPKVTAEWIKLEGHFFHLVLTEDQCQQAASYLQLLQKWNKKVNLTGIRSPEEAVRLHFLESFFAAKQLPSGYLRVVDVGSGAGFPGLAMKIVRPDLRVVLLDSRKKKVMFQKEVIRRLEIQHVSAYQLRLEEGAFFLRQAYVVCWRALRLEGRDMEFLLANTPASCLFACFQGMGERMERALQGLDVTKVPIPCSQNRTLLLARRTRDRVPPSANLAER